jgi:hypothetical protein
MARQITIVFLNKRLEIINRELGLDFTLDHSYGGYRVEARRGSVDVSPRMKKAELVAWLDGFWAAAFKIYN